jgi:hypothetical protein
MLIVFLPLVRVTDQCDRYQWRHLCVIQQKVNPVLVVEPDLAYLRAFQLLEFQAFPIPSGAFVRGSLNKPQLSLSRFDYRGRQREFMRSVRSYKGEASIGKLDLHGDI